MLCASLVAERKASRHETGYHCSETQSSNGRNDESMHRWESSSEVFHSDERRARLFAGSAEARHVGRDGGLYGGEVFAERLAEAYQARGLSVGLAGPGTGDHP